MEEIWININVDYKGSYQISNKGNIREIINTTKRTLLIEKKGFIKMRLIDMTKEKLEFQFSVLKEICYKKNEFFVK